MESRRGPGEILRRLARVAPIVRGAVAGAVVSRTLGVGAQLVQSWYLARALGALFDRSGVDVSGDLVIAAIATLFRAVVLSGGDRALAALARPVRRRLHVALLERALSGSLALGVDRLTLLATDGVNAVETYLSSILPALSVAVLAPALVIGALVWSDPLSALIVVVCLGVLPLFMVLLGLAARDSMEERLAAQTTLAGYFGEVVRGLATLRALGRSSSALDSLAEADTSYQRSTLETLRVAFLSGFALELLASLATALVALVLGIRLVGGHVGLTTALFVLVATPEAFVPLRTAAAQYHASSLGVASAGEILDLVEVPLTARGLAEWSTGSPRVELRGVVVGSSEREGVRTRPVDAVVEPGEMLVILGVSGVGKSTLLRVLCGLDRPLEGQVLIEGREPFEYAPIPFRRRVALLSQDPVLPGRSVREILDLGRGLGDDELRSSLDDCALALDLDEIVGEGASRLSAGQRRRLGLARAIAGHPDLLLLDEPLAHLDEANASHLEHTLRQLTMTRVVVTHRPLAAEGVLRLASAEAP